MKPHMFKERLAKFIAALPRFAPVPEPSSSGELPATHPLISVLAQFAASIVSSLVAAWIVQDFLRYNFSLAVILSFVFFFALSTILQVRFFPLRFNLYIVLTILFTVVIVQGVLLAFLYAATRPATVHLVLDATERATPYFDDLRRSILFASQVQPTDGKSGLRVYGGNLGQDTECSNTVQLIEPISMDDYQKELDSVLYALAPGGHASLTIAVLDAVRYDLARHKGPIKLIVITAGVDPDCEPRKGDIFERMAEDIRENTRGDVTIAIIGVGELSIQEESLLMEYAEAFSGTYLSIPAASDLAPLIGAPRSYFSQYSQQLPQPTPISK